ncbi:hypothetical protein GYMLUDRAFT_38083 [Collybiopsis luxurians FD-317 M1]|nr:hypothetical protein GYMLUDRAFT_38083 [Collybiopsis luxurians FD-317 M1]
MPSPDVLACPCGMRIVQGSMGIRVEGETGVGSGLGMTHKVDGGEELNRVGRGGYEGAMEGQDG